MTTFSTSSLAQGSAVEIVGVDLGHDIGEDTLTELRRLLGLHRILVFRGQSLSADQQIAVMMAFGRVLDELHDGSMHSYVSTTADSLVRPGRLLFHSDNHFMPEPVEVLSLYGSTLGDRSAPTLFVDNIAAYRRLSPEMVRTLTDAEVTNVSYYFFGQGGDRPSRSVDPDHQEAPRATHRAIWRHPVTGEPFVYVTELHSHHFVGMTRSESDELLDLVHEVMYTPEDIYTHYWKAGDLVIWDNRAVQHARGPVPDAEIDPNAEPRSLRRVLVGTRDYVEQVEALEHAAG